MGTVIENVSVTASKNCLYGCLYQIMRNHGASMNEAEVFICSNGLDINYDVTLHTLRLGAYEDVLRSFTDTVCAQTKISYDIHSDDVIQSLSQNELVVLYVDPSVLHYYEFFTESESSAHFILMYGIEPGEKLYVIDPYLVNDDGSVSTFQGEVPFSEIERGIRGIAHISLAHSTVPGRNQIRAIGCKGITQFIQNQEQTGIHAIYHYLHDIKRFESLSDSGFEKKMTEVVYTLKSGIFLYMYDYLQTFVSQYVNSYKRMSTINQTLQKQLVQWNKLLAMILQAGYSGKRKYIDRIVTRSEELIDELESIMLDIKSALQQV